MTAPDGTEPTLGELVGELGSDLSRLVRKEIELAKIEAKEEADRLTKAAVSGAIAVVAALLALTLLSFALAWWIDLELNTAVAFAIVGALWVVVAVVTAMAARTKLKQVRPMPETTDAIKGAVAGERADNTTTPTHAISGRNHAIKETP